MSKGRKELNFSEWDRPPKEVLESAKSIQKGKMPPAVYAWLHPEARLTSAERDALIRGLDATFGSEARPQNGEGERRRR